MTKRIALWGLCLVLISPYAWAQVSVELEINAEITDVTDDDSDDFVTWSPVNCRARLVGSSGPGTETVHLSNLAGGGDVAFDQLLTPWPADTTATKSTLQVVLPKNGSWVGFVIAGKFGSPSTKDEDTVIQCRLGNSTGAVLGQEELMVRVRKDAAKLTVDERDRYLAAVAQLNTLGDYAQFQRMHAVASAEAHGGPGFLPWHRAMLLQYERLLQSVDPSVTLPYWKFDESAANVFSQDFMGANGRSVAFGRVAVDFSATNPLSGWEVQGLRLVRGTANRASTPPVQNDTATLNPINPGQYRSFVQLERNPHGSAHVWVGGWMGSVPTAVRDPIFFMLHCNVDRLWAQWQHDRGRFDPNSSSTYSAQSGGLVGHNVNDTMWPWNDVTTAPRPSVAPGSPFAPAAPFDLGPPAAPTPGDTIDYAGHSVPSDGLGFCYEQVPFGS